MPLANHPAPKSSSAFTWWNASSCLPPSADVVIKWVTTNYVAQNSKVVDASFHYCHPTSTFSSQSYQFLVFFPRDILCIYKQILIFRYMDFFSQVDSVLNTNGSTLYSLFCTLLFKLKILSELILNFLWVYTFHYMDILFI